MNRKVQIVANGDEINTASMNPVMVAKVADVIQQLDEVNSPNTNIVVNQRLLKMNQIERWVKLRQQSGLSAIQTMHESDLADEIFKIWDRKLRRYIKFEEFARHLIALGLAPDQNVVKKIMVALKGEHASFPDQLNIKEFRHLFDMSRFGTKANEKIVQEFKEATAEFAHKQFVKIIGSQVMADLDKKQPKNKKKLTKEEQKSSAEITLKATDANINKLEMMK